ncbi:MAG: hypothetical protein GXZ11_05725 [Tissierellia bacterium]|nr:hypothetical protein [Tissierellia bacterium]
MDKETLKNYADLKYEIHRIEKRIEKLQKNMVHDSVTGSNPEFPYQHMSIPIEGIDADRIEKLSSILHKRKEKAELQRLEIEEFIADIPDCRTRMIFEDRYVHDKSWLSISRKWGSRNESYARMIHDRYLDKINMPRCL